MIHDRLFEERPLHMPAGEEQTWIAASDVRRLRLSTVAVSLVMAVILYLMGQPLWCKCGGISPWSWDIWSSHNSQHLVDPYFFTHVLHGVVLCGLLYRLPRRVSDSSRFLTAVVLEAGWEILENSPTIIERYRAATISKDYFGDSIINSAGDLIACILGFLLARQLGVRRSIVFFLLTELILLITIRDCLVLNVLMLAYPSEVIKNWQMHG
jgi:hypothetical protein